MIPAKFDYVRAGSTDEAVSMLAAHGPDAKLLAGGHSLLPLMKMRLATPPMLVDVARIRDLSYVREQNGNVVIGALTRHRELETSEVLGRHVPLLAHAASLVGDPQVRHRGTLGGTLAHGDPASDLPAAVLALNGTLVVQSRRGRREIPATEFFRDFLETALAPDEMIVEVRVPKMNGSGWSFQKFHRRAQDWAIVGCAVVRGGQTGVALVNMGPTPMRAPGVEQALQEGALPEDAAAHAADGTQPTTDLNANAEFRRHLARVLVRRALVEAGTT
jgi:aerobic carbon-monoxide dehydrogenase medium subunit